MPRTRKTITRSEILKAIRTEPLVSGNFVQTENNKEKNCAVCAVGAVLRIAGQNNTEIHSFGEQLMYEGVCSSQPHYVILEELKERRYLHALSMKFEFYAFRLGKGKRTRKLLANFVKKNFPKVIKLNPEF